MKLLRRNTTEFEYLPYEGVQERADEDGEHTGEYQDHYGNAVLYRGNISTPSGWVNQTFYGEDIRYTHTLVMDDPKADINERGLVRWKGEEYDILSVKPTINALSVAMRKRTVDHAEGDGW